jgi:hypothetical protein
MNAQNVVKQMLESTGLFVGAVLTPASRAELLRRIPPTLERVIAHHVTMAYDPDEATLSKYRDLEGEIVHIPVVAYADDGKAQAALVGVESENDYPHITISVADGIKPVYSNTTLATADHIHVNIFTLEGVVTIEPL